MSEEKRLPSQATSGGLKKKEKKTKSSLQIRLSFIFIFLLAPEEDLFSSRNIGQFV